MSTRWLRRSLWIHALVHETRQGGGDRQGLKGLGPSEAAEQNSRQPLREGGDGEKGCDRVFHAVSRANCGDGVPSAMRSVSVWSSSSTATARQVTMRLEQVMSTAAATGWSTPPAARLMPTAL
jgi:hypothetical protein